MSAVHALSRQYPCRWWGLLALCILAFATPCLAQPSSGNGNNPAPQKTQTHSASSDCGGYSLAHKPFINPGIIKDLETWVSDSGEQIVSINVPGSMGTNRYSHSFKVIPHDYTDYPDVRHEDKSACKKHGCNFGSPFFDYRLIGRTTSGLSVLVTVWGGGGSGHFENVLIVALKHDKGLAYAPAQKTLKMDRNRCLITRMAEIALGDRYQGTVRVEGNTLFIGRDHNPHSAGLFKHDTTLHIDPADAQSAP